MSTNTCYYCTQNKRAHSFFCFQVSKNKKNKKYIFTYKTNIKDAELYDNPESIIHHIEHEPHIKRTNHWKWILDFTDASLKHYMALNTVSELSRWIQREKNNKCENLEQIVILGTDNNMLIYPLIYLAKVFLPSHIEIVAPG